MAHSSLLGIDIAPAVPPGHDAAALGPSDTSDSGSDVVGIEGLDEGDAMPLDAGAEDPHPAVALGSDGAGTGEAGSATGARPVDGADIAPDRIVVDPDAELAVDEEPADDALLDAAASTSDGDEDDPDALT